MLTTTLLPVFVIILGLSGCSDSRPIVGPDNGADERGPATRTVVSVTSLAGEFRVPLAARTEDECGVEGAGFQPADYGRDYSCGVGRVALYALTASGGVEAALTAHSSLVESGCTSTEPFTEHPDVAELHSDAPGSHALEASYVCSAGGVRAVLAQADDPRIRNLADTLPATPSGTYVVQDPPIDLTVIDELAPSESAFILLLTASEKYFSATVCNGLHAC